MGMNPGDRIAGLVGQSMGGPKSRPPVGLGAVDTANSGASPFTALTDCTVTIYAYGSGAGSVSGAGSGGGGGGAAGRKTVVLMAGQKISWTYQSTNPASGASGSDTIITLPDGAVLTAGSGKTGSGSNGGAGGVCSGPWDLARSGGQGGTNTGSGSAGQFGGAGGVGNGSTSAGGGGAGGFTDQPYSGPSSGAGAPGGTPNGIAVGGGAGQSGVGTTGRVILHIVQQ